MTRNRIFLYALFLIILATWANAFQGCKVKTRTATTQESHQVKFDSLYLSGSVRTKTLFRSVTIKDSGAKFILDSVRKPWKPGESLPEYLAENSRKVILYDYGKKVTDIRKNTAKDSTSTRVRRSDSTGVTKTVTVLKNKSWTAGLRWYHWLGLFFAVVLLLFIYVRKIIH